MGQTDDEAPRSRSRPSGSLRSPRRSASALLRARARQTPPPARITGDSSSEETAVPVAALALALDLALIGKFSRKTSLIIQVE
eukprot:9606039-Heterocapsa_arctica.AAC.1